VREPLDHHRRSSSRRTVMAVRATPAGEMERNDCLIRI
jgi:hypothetical protein